MLSISSNNINKQFQYNCFTVHLTKANVCTEKVGPIVHAGIRIILTIQIRMIRVWNLFFIKQLFISVEENLYYNIKITCLDSENKK